jgi:SAM-dependent methyltransferase
MSSALRIPTPQQSKELSPELFFETARGFQRTAALKTAIELDLFTTIAGGATDVAAIAKRCAASERGIRILCDYLTVIGFLTKADGKYGLTPESDMFLNKKSRAYIGCSVEFLCGPAEITGMQNLTTTVRNGKPTFAPAHESSADMWVSFARNMMPLLYPGAQALAAQIPLPNDRDIRVLDIASSHGMWGLSVGQRFPRARVVGLDWPRVVEVGKENAERLGLATRFSTIEGDAFTADFGGSYDAILLPNFLHHFNAPTSEKLLKKCHAHLRDGGLVAIVEFVPNEDRVSPAVQAEFALTMLGETESGDAYTLSELKTMLTHVGFREVDGRPLGGLPQTLVTARK